MNTEVISVDPARPDPGALAHAAGLLHDGAVAAFPTETVYGLGCLSGHSEPAARIYALKGRVSTKPLAVYLAEPDDIFQHAALVPSGARRLIEQFLPGPLTIILRDEAGTKTGFRVSPSPVLRGLIEAVGKPLVGTSANVSGAPSPTTAAGVLHAFEGRIELVLDAGQTELGVDSTVIDCTGPLPAILREGALSAAGIAEVLGLPVEHVWNRPTPPAQ